MATTNPFKSAFRPGGTGDQGNLAIITALVMVPMVGAAGMAIDYNRITAVKTNLQAALDSATLASAAKDGGLSASAAESYFDANIQADGVTVEGPEFSTDADGTIVATLDATIPAGLMAIMGLTDTTVSLTSKALGSFATKITSATFEITNAQGAYDKDIYLFTRDEDGNILTETLVLQYNYGVSSGKGKKTFTPATGVSTTISVGAYETYGIKMVVYQDLTYKGKHINPVSFYSDDEDAASWSKTTGDCATTQTQNWEDGGDSNYLDFVFTLTCDTSGGGSTTIRLTQ